MRKRFVTALITGLLSAVCALGFTACGDSPAVNPPENQSPETDEEINLEMPLGEQVTEEQWRTALEEPVYSITSIYEEQSEDYYYQESICLGTDSQYAKYVSVNYENFTGTVENYIVVTENIIWECKKSEEKYGDKNWHTDNQEYSSASTATQAFVSHYNTVDLLSAEFYTSEDDTEEKSFADLYSEFTYSEGKYTAKLYQYFLGKCTVELSFKDGKIIWLKALSEETYADESQNKFYCSITNINQTTVTAPQGALDAINAEQNK